MRKLPNDANPLVCAKKRTLCRTCQPHHVTQRGVDRKDVFFSRTDRLTYLSLAKANAQRCQVRVYAWCLMTNHVH